MSGPATVRVAANSMELEQCIECNSVYVAVNGYLCNQGLASTGMEGNEHTLYMFTIEKGYYHFLLLGLGTRFPGMCGSVN